MLTQIESYFSVLMLFGASQAVTGIFLLLKNKARPYSNNMLALLLLVWGFSCYWFFAFIHQGAFFSVVVTTLIGPMLAILYFPPLFLYVKFLFYEHKKFPKWDHLHFLPLYAYVLFTLYLLWSSDFSIEVMRQHPWYYSRTLACSYLAAIQGPFYFIKTNRILKLRHRLLQEEYSEIESRKLEWFKIINYSFALVFILGGISAIIRTSYLDPYLLYMGYHVVMALSLFYITLMIYKYPIIFTQTDSVRVASKKEHMTSPKTIKTPISEEQSIDDNEAEKNDAIVLRIETLMQEEKPFKNPNFSLNDMAHALSESRNAISYVLNNRMHKNFYNYINELRIEESKRLLSDRDLLNFTIEGIASESGFKTMSVFYRFFKDSEKVTPAVYRKNALTD